MVQGKFQFVLTPLAEQDDPEDTRPTCIFCGKKRRDGMGTALWTMMIGMKEGGPAHQKCNDEALEKLRDKMSKTNRRK